MSIEFRFSGSEQAMRVRQFLEEEGQLSSYAAEVLDEPDLSLWIALDNERVVGILVGILMPFDDGFRGGVAELVVAGDRRRQGIARHRMEWAEDYFRAAGAMGIQFMVDADNKPAVDLYRSLGYRTVRVRMRKDF